MLILLGASCGTTTTTTAQPKTSSAPSTAAAGGPYRAVVAAEWPAIADSFKAAPCDKVDSSGLPIDRAACTTASTTLMTLAKKLRADLMAQSPPDGLAGADSDLKAALDDLSSRLAQSNQAIERGDAPAFAEAGGAIADAYHNALRAQAAITK